MSNLKNKVTIVTGASRGLGATIVKAIAAAGSTVVVNYVGNKAAADEVVNDIKSNGGTALAVQADVSKSADAKRLFDEAIKAYGRVDVLVNNAGIMLVKPIIETTDEDFDKQFDINVKGTFNMLREAVTRLADNGTVINTSTSIIRNMVPGYSTYGASKAAVEQLTRVFSKEAAKRGITANTVAPGPFNTELFLHGKTEEAINRGKASSNAGRLGEPEDLAPVVVFLASDEAKWVTGQVLGVNGGMA